MKIEYQQYHRKDITPKEEQVIYDYLTRKIAWTQASRALDCKFPNQVDQKIAKIVKHWAKTGNITIKKKDY